MFGGTAAAPQFFNQGLEVEERRWLLGEEAEFIRAGREYTTTLQPQR
jgi:hypothetical protein